MKLRLPIGFVLGCICAAVLASNASALQMYTPDYNDDQIIGIDFKGVAPATALPGSPWTISNGGEWAIGINRDGVRAVTSYGFTPSIKPFTIAADGSITSPQPTLVGTGGFALAMSPTSDLVYFLGSSAPYGITVARQAADGSLTYIPGSPFASGGAFGDLAITPDGKYLFASGSPAGTVRRFSIAADGSLTAIGSATVAGAGVMQTSPDGRFLYVLGSSGNDFVHCLAIGSDGSLTEVPPAYDVGDSSTGKIAVSPNGSRLYLPNSNLDQIVTLASSSTGVLSLVGSTPVPDDYEAAAASATGELFFVRTNAGGGLYYSKPDPVTTIPPVPVQLVAENWNYGTRTAFRPGTGGTAGALKITPNAKPLSFTLDASGSTGFDRLDWSTGGIAEVTRTSATRAKFDAPKPGVIPISVKAVDSSGCASDLLYTGQLFVCTGNPNAIKSASYDTPPWITSLKVSPSKVTSRTKIKFKLTEKASVSFYAQKPLPGRTVGKSCKKQTSKNKKAKKCTRWVRASKTFRKNGKAGRTNSVKFTGKVGKKRLANGSYRLYAVATDSAKGKGPAKTARFRIK
ncbi:MAG: beta-propeller fold lactonase family protein [Thermoleophilaceae bacterium]|nr:beta-propeller fold lactonase family protein [Thermoleophilaceae bacterium]